MLSTETTIWMLNLRHFEEDGSPRVYEFVSVGNPRLRFGRTRMEKALAATCDKGCCSLSDVNDVFKVLVDTRVNVGRFFKGRGYWEWRCTAALENAKGGFHAQNMPQVKPESRGWPRDEFDQFSGGDR